MDRGLIVFRGTPDGAAESAGLVTAWATRHWNAAIAPCWPMGAHDPRSHFHCARSQRGFARRVALGLLRLELHHSTMIWVLPLLGALFYFDPSARPRAIHRFGSCAPRLSCTSWSRISRVPRGVAAGPDRGRDGAKQSTCHHCGRPRWSTALASFAATTIGPWCRSSLRRRALRIHGDPSSWGGPPWWPVAAGAAVLCAFCALGFAAGVLLPGRFTAPLAALVTSWCS